MTSLRVISQNSRTLAFTCAVSRPKTLKIRPASLGSRQAPNARRRPRFDIGTHALGKCDRLYPWAYTKSHCRTRRTVHHARLTHRISLRLDHQLLVEQRAAVRASRGDRHRHHVSAEALVRMMMFSARLDDLRIEKRRGRSDGDPCITDEPSAPMRDHGIGKKLQICIVGKREVLRVAPRSWHPCYGSWSPTAW